jgi:hypothetical protein
MEIACASGVQTTVNKPTGLSDFHKPGCVHGVSLLTIATYELLLFKLHGTGFQKHIGNSFIFFGKNRAGNVNQGCA